MTQQLRVAIIAGGLNHEREVSLRSAHRVARALREAGHEVNTFCPDASLLASLRNYNPDVVWPLVHGSTGEDGSLQNILLALEVPFVGTHSDGCQRASYKPTAKAGVRTAGVATPDSLTLPQSFFNQLGANELLDLVIAHLGLPLVVKPFQGGSALGVSYADDVDSLRSAMVECFAYSDNALIEVFVEGVETSVSVVRDGDGVARALPTVEIVTDGSYDYDARYNPGRSEFFVPARLDQARDDAVREAAVKVHETLGLGALSRSDFIVDAEGTPWFIDVNVVPGMTETSLLPLAAEVDGNFTQLCQQLVLAAYNNYQGEGQDAQ